MLDDTVAKFIPGFADLKLADGTVVGKAMTVRDLLRHTSGLTYGFHNRTAVDAAYRKLRIAEMDTPGGLPAMIAQLESLPLEYAPGTRWIYSVSIDVVGWLVQVISGRAFAGFVRENILAPLGMRDTDFIVPREKSDRFAACYQLMPSRLELFTAYPNAKYFDPAPAGIRRRRLAGTAGDYLRFARMLLNRANWTACGC